MHHPNKEPDFVCVLFLSIILPFRRLAIVGRHIARRLRAYARTFSHRRGARIRSAWIRQPYLERVIPSAATFLAATIRRTTGVGYGRVIVSADGASARTRERYRAFAEAHRARTFAPHGERRIVYAPDLVGTADEIVGMLLDDSVLAQIRELRLELPYDLPFENYGQILRDFITRLVTELGWRSMAMRWTAVA